jgi:PAS domain S-box-containing protein
MMARSFVYDGGQAELFHERALAERTAWIRVTLTLASLAIIVFDPRVPPEGTIAAYARAIAGWTPFFIYAVAARWLLKRRRVRLTTYAYASPLLDVVFASILLYASHAFSRPFNLWFVFAVMVSGFSRSRMFPFVTAGMALVANLLIAVLPPTYPVNLPTFAIRNAYTFAIAAVLSLMCSHLLEDSKLLAVIEDAGRRLATAMTEEEVRRVFMDRVADSLGPASVRLCLPDGRSFETGLSAEGLVATSGPWRLESGGEELGTLYLNRNTPLTKGEQWLAAALSDRAASAFFRIRVSDRLAEESLASERLKSVETLVDNLPGFFFMVDKTGRFVRWNKNRAVLTGYSEKELAEFRGLDLVVPEHRARVAEALGTAFREGSATGEYDILTKDGRRVTCVAEGRRVRIGDAEFVIVSAIDISDRREMEQRLEQEKQFSDSAIDALPGLFLMFDEQGRMVRHNRYFGVMLGYSPEEMANFHYLDHVASKDRPIITGAIQEALRGGTGTIEYSVIAKDGREVRCLASGRGVTIGGARFAIATVMDITDRKRAEEALRTSESRNRTLIENLPRSIFYKDRDSVYITCNSDFARTLGVAPEDLPGKTDYDLFPRDQAERYHASDRRIMASGVPEQLEVEQELQDGRKRCLVVTKAPVRDPSGGIVGVVGIIQDVTEQKQAEAALADRLRFETVITDLSARLVTAAPERLDDEINAALERLLGLFQVERAGLLEYSEDQSTAHLIYAAYPPDTKIIPERFDYVSRSPWIDARMREGTVVFIPSLESLPPEAGTDRATFESMEISSVAAVPLRVGDSVRYVVSVVDRKPRRWPEELIPRLRLFGEVIVNALERRRGTVRLRDRFDFETLVSDLSSRFITAPPRGIEEAIKDGLRDIVAFMHVDRATLSQFSRDRDLLRIAYSWTAERFPPARHVVLNKDYPWYVAALRRGEIVSFSRPDELPDEAGRDLELALQGGIKSHLAIPLHAGGAVFGALAFTTLSEERAWPAELIQRLRFIGEIFANAIIRAQVGRALLRSQRDLRKLAGRLLTAQEAERRRLARELHDDLSQRLAALAIEAGELELESDSSARVRDKVRSMKEQVIRLSEDVHAMSRQLHPAILDDLGLIDALESECQRFSRHDRITVAYDVKNVPSQIPKDVALCVYRVVQEGLRNVAKHARTDRAEVSLEGKDDALILRIADAGAGFDPSRARKKAGLGLESMRERVRSVLGDLSVRSDSGRGTIIDVRIPLQRSKP